MLSDQAPKFDNGDLALCHGCQRWTQIDGSLEKYLLRRIKLEAHQARIRKAHSAEPHCLTCGSLKLYTLESRPARRCAKCGKDVPMSPAPSAKRSPETYAKARAVFAETPDLSATAFAERVGVTYKTAWRWLKALQSGTFGS